jgi:kynurenine formamidase
VRPDLLLAHTELTRRAALGLAGKAAATAALAGAGVTAATAAPAAATTVGEVFDDAMFNVAAVERGEWAPTRYGAGDQRGTFNEVTPATTARALRLLASGRPTKTYNLGELMTNGFPAFKTTPPRVYQQRLTVTGYQPPADFEQGGGILQTPTPLGPNRISIHEERFPQGYTYQIVTQLDNLNHIGVGATFYNGFRGPEIAEPYGTNKLGSEHMGPIVTRGVLLDVLGLKLARGDRAALSQSKDGQPVLRDDYRIRIEDLTAAAGRVGIRRINPGDVVLIRTGWNKIARSEPERYLAKEPGIYLREARFLANFRPAIIGADSWALEVLGNPVVTAAFPVHQELLVKHGIRIGEGIITDELARDGVYEFVYITTPQYAKGATAGNAPPAALGQPRR